MLTDNFQTTAGERNVLRNLQSKHWLQPEQGEVKVNSNGAFHEATKSGGWGFVIRDADGQVIRAGAGREEFLQNVFHSMGAGRTILETDATMVRSALEGDDFRLSSMRGIITEIKHLLDVPVSCKISVCSRVCNKVAHAVAASHNHLG
jgi:hypothetical protein